MHTDRIIAVRCPVKVQGWRNKKAEQCQETFPLKETNNLGTYNIAGYHRHLAEVHGIRIPKPLLVTDSGRVEAALSGPLTWKKSRARDAGVQHAQHLRPAMR